MTPKHKFFYGWIIVFLAFISVTMFGVPYSYSTFIESLENYLQASRTAISAGYTIEMIFYAIFAVIMGWLCDRYGPRSSLWLAAVLMGSGVLLTSRVTSLWQLYVFYSIVGMGHGASLVVPSSVVTRWFIKRRGLALGLTACGLGFGLSAFPPLSEYIIRTYGWRTSFVCLGILAFVGYGIAATFMRSKPEDMGLKALGAGEVLPPSARVSVRDYTLPEILKARAFWVVFLTAVFCYGAEQMLVAHMVPYCRTIGLTAAQASLGLTFLGIGTIAGRVGMGALSDRIGRIPALMLSCALQTLTTFLLLAISGPWVLYIIMLLVGYGYGGWAVLNIVVLGDFFGVKNVGKAIGFYFFNAIPAGILGPLLAGYIYDVSQSYFFAIIFAGAICAIPVLLQLTIVRHKPDAVADTSASAK